MSSAIPLSPAPQAAALLAWYDRHRRTLPWRAQPGETADPYRVWLSEIMLQQTTVAAVIPYFERFVVRFPNVGALAAAPLDAVLAAWAGLGYYARARNLHACARAVASADGFPDTLAGLEALPGVGGYTAAAIGAIAFGIPVVPVDGNVERIASRIFAVEAPLPKAKPAIRNAAKRFGADPDARRRPSDFAQALFDLGATVCTPAQPVCGLCPWMRDCAGRIAGIAAGLPRKSPKPPRPVRYGAAFWIENGEGRVLLRRRPENGLLGGMTELPGTPWRERPWTQEEALALAPAGISLWRAAGQVRHGFTHFELILNLFAGEAGHAANAQDGFLLPLTDLGGAALPSVMRKCAAMVRRGGRLSSDAPPG